MRHSKRVWSGQRHGGAAGAVLWGVASHVQAQAGPCYEVTGIIVGPSCGIMGPATVTWVLSPIKASPADLTGDCHVDWGDLQMFQGEWGETSSPADFNADGMVDVLDLLFRLGSWG